MKRELVVEQTASGSGCCVRDIIASEGNEQPAELGAVFQVHADHFESGLVRAHEAHHSLHADRAQARGDFQGGFGAHGKLQFTAEKASIETEDADGGRIFSLRGGDHGGHVARQANAAVAAMAHEIALGDGVERGELENFRIQTRLRQEILNPARIELDERLGRGHANLVRKLPAESFALLDKTAEVTGGGRSAHAAQRFDGLHAQVIGALRQYFAFGKPKKLGGGLAVTAHANFVERERKNHNVQHFERIGEELAALRSAGSGKLANNSIMETASTITKAPRQEFVHGCRIQATEQADYSGGFRRRVIFE